MVSMKFLPFAFEMGMGEVLWVLRRSGHSEERKGTKGTDKEQTGG